MRYQEELPWLIQNWRDLDNSMVEMFHMIDLINPFLLLVLPRWIDFLARNLSSMALLRGFLEGPGRVRQRVWQLVSSHRTSFNPHEISSLLISLSSNLIGRPPPMDWPEVTAINDNRNESYFALTDLQTCKWSFLFDYIAQYWQVMRLAQVNSCIIFSQIHFRDLELLGKT